MRVLSLAVAIGTFVLLGSIAKPALAFQPPSAVTPVAGKPEASPLAARFDDLLLAGVEEGLQGVALHVARGDSVPYAGAAGVASRESNTPLAPSDRFRIYSITKTFTAVLILQLVDQGVLSLDDTVTDWLHDPAVARIPHIDQITLRHLLTQTSGVHDYFASDSPFWQDAYLGESAEWSRVWQPEELLAYADGARQAPDFAPGEGIHYSNTGYILLGLIVEEASGQTFGDRLHKQILDPLELADTSFAADGTLPAGVVDGYQEFGGELVNVSAINLSAQWSAGGLVSTSSDLARFADALFAGGELLTPSSLREMLTFTPAERPGIAWGMGVARMETPSGEMIGMGGSGPGFAGFMFSQPETELTVVLLTNSALEDDTATTIFDRAVRLARDGIGSAARM